MVFQDRFHEVYALEVVFGASWGVFGASWGVLLPSWGVLGPPKGGAQLRFAEGVDAIKMIAKTRSPLGVARPIL